MSECTKGILTQGKSNTLLYINGINFGDVLVGGLPHEECEANAEEIVRRWNAFEEGGLVEELRTALERYGEHETGCTLGDACNCGFNAALAKS